MEQEQLEMVEASWTTLRPRSDALARHFYASLFEADPALRVLFEPDLAAQQQKLVDMLQVVVEGLRAPSELASQLAALGARHLQYGVVDSDYHAVANAFMAAIEALLGPHFTVEMRLAWTAAFRLIATGMKAGAAAADAELASDAGAGPVSVRQRKLVQGSWRLLQGKTARLARMFYGALFAREPSMRTLFADDMTSQRGRFLAAIDVAVTGLDDISTLRPVVAELGQRHIGYGVRESDYEVVAQALIAALQRCLGDIFTPELRSAWIETYGMLAQMMLDGGAAGRGGRASKARAPRAAAAHDEDGGKDGSELSQSGS